MFPELRRAGFMATALLAVVAPASAQPSPQQAAYAQTPEGDRLELFKPRPGGQATQLDYSVWDEALQSFVFTMGRSLREGSPSVEPGIGTRFVYGHTSRYRMEGNRVVFEYMRPEIIQLLSEYRRDLERIGSEYDIAGLSRNEQLAFWMNLHNVAVIEQIALAYPLGQPSNLRVGQAQLLLDESPFITVAGVTLSPKDIRTRIVYPHWSDARVIYGFWRGDIGGPSIQRRAFTADNVDRLLNEAGREFVNSLRGTQRNGDELQVSRIYEEARPYYFTHWPHDIKTHLRRFSDATTNRLIEGSGNVVASVYETDIADLSRGALDPNYSYVVAGDTVRGSGLNPAIGRLLFERQNKMEKIMRENARVGTVTLINPDETEEKAPREVD